MFSLNTAPYKYLYKKAFKLIKFSLKLPILFINIFKPALKYFKIWHKLNMLGRAILIVIVVLIAFISYQAIMKIIEPGLIGKYEFVKLNNNELKPYILDIRNDIAIVSICSDFVSKYRNSNGSIMIDNLPSGFECQEQDLGILYQFLFGFRSGYVYHTDKNGLSLYDPSRDNTFTLRRIK